jgi:hypothetical protein
MGPAYKKLCPADQVSLTLTPARWLGLISSCSTPATMEQLASSAATLLAEETFLTIAARYPVKTAIRIAQALGPASGGSPLDLRLAHLSLDELIANQPNFADKADDVGAKVTAAVMTLRSSRLNTSFEAGSARLRTHREAAVAEAEGIRRQFKVETEAKAQLEAERARERAQAKRDLEEFQAQKERELQAERRRWQARLGYVPFAILLALAVLQVNLVWAAAAVLGLLVFWHQATEWTHDPKRGWRSFLPAAVIEVVGLAAAVWPLLQSK